MAGTRKGGLRACQTNKERYGEDFYIRIGAIGGSRTGLKGFALDRKRASEAGRKGGQISRRRAVVKNDLLYN